MTGGGHRPFAAPMPPASGGLGERRVALAVTISAIGLFVAFLAIMPAPFPSFDEWKYFGIGYNIWAGRGLTTVFGGDFLLHGPIWSSVVTLPHVLFGADTAAWGRLLNGLAGATIVSLAAWFGWRIRPSVGAFAAVIMVAIVYLHDQSRTARLDVPAATVALLYIAVAFESIRRDSTRWAIAAGLIFAIGFLIKEIGLPFAPIPFLAATLWRVPWLVLVRVTAWSLLVATLGVSWWFLLYGLQNGRFYRLESPAWTLIPVALLIGLLVVAGLAFPRLSRSSSAHRFAASVWGPRLNRRARLVVAWGGACVWAAGQLIAFSRTTRLKGGPLLSAHQLDLYADQWIKPFWVAALVAAVGIALLPFALAACRSRSERSAVLDLIIAGMCGAPLVIFVIGVGEPPRNYLAQIALAAPLVGVGSLWAARWWVSEPRAWRLITVVALTGAIVCLVTGARLGVEPLSTAAVGALSGAAIGSIPVAGRWLAPVVWPRLRSGVTVALLLAGLVIGTALLGVRTLQVRASPNGPVLETAVSTAAAWIRANVPAGSRLAFGSSLGYPLALTLSDRFEVFHARHGNVSLSVEAPDGIKRTGERPMDDWVSIDTAPRNANEFQAFRAGWLERDLVGDRIDYWVYTVGTATSAHTILAAVSPENGFEQVAHWAFPLGASGRAIETYVFRVDRTKVRFDPTVMYLSPEALDRMLDILERDAPAAREVAGRLADQVRLAPASPGDDALMIRLRRLAGG